MNFIQLNKFTNLHDGNKIIFCKTDFLFEEFNTIKNLDSDVILITGNSDYPITDYHVSHAPSNIKKYTPNNSFYGVPDVIPAKTALAGDEFASRFNLDYFENKAVPRYIITVKGATLSRDAERKLLEFFH